MRLAFYSNEFARHRESYDEKLSWDGAEFVLSKLCRHFKISARLHYDGHRAGGCANRFGDITLGRHGLNFGTLCHEVGHVVEFKKFGESGHRKRTMRIVARINAYCKKKNYWREHFKAVVERATLRAQKRYDAEHKPKELLLQEQIVKRQAEIVRYEKRLAYFTKLYSNKIKKARRSIAALERHKIVVEPVPLVQA